MKLLGYLWVAMIPVFALLVFFKDKPSNKKLFKALVMVFVLILPFAATGWVGALNSALLFSILALGLNLLLGNAGQISLGHIGFFALGAYVTGALTVKAGYHFIPAIFLGGVAIALFAFAIGTPILRLKGHFLGIATLGMHIVIEELVKDNLKKYEGLENIAQSFKISSLNFVKKMDFSLRDLLGSKDYSALYGKEKPFYYDILSAIQSNIGEIAIFFVGLIILVLLVYMVRNILRTRVGRALGALRDSEVAARALGINIALYKNLAFGLSGFIAGVAGGLYALSTGSLAETSFPLLDSLVLLAMVVLGGLGSIQGAIIGATIFKLLDFKIIKELIPQYQQLSPAFLGLAVVLMVIFAPKGIVYMLYQLKLKISQKRS